MNYRKVNDVEQLYESGIIQRPTLVEKKDSLDKQHKPSKREEAKV